MSPEHEKVYFSESEEFISSELFGYLTRQALDHTDLAAAQSRVLLDENAVRSLDSILIGLRCFQLPAPNGGYESYIFIEDHFSSPIVFFSVFILPIPVDELVSEIMSVPDRVKKLNAAVGRMLVQRKWHRIGRLRGA